MNRILALGSRLPVQLGALFALALMLPMSAFAATADTTGSFNPFPVQLVEIPAALATVLGPFLKIVISVMNIALVLAVILFLFQGFKMGWKAISSIQAKDNAHGDASKTQDIVVGLVRSLAILGGVMVVVFIMITKSLSIFLFLAQGAVGLFSVQSGSLQKLVGLTFAPLVNQVMIIAAALVLMLGLWVVIKRAFGLIKLVELKTGRGEGEDHAKHVKDAIVELFLTIAIIVVVYLFLAKGVDIILSIVTGAGSLVNASTAPTLPLSN